jgi:hypothetical protein
MGSKKRFKLNPLPIEVEFRVLSIKHRLHQLSREELELFLTEALSTMSKLAHQVTQLRDHVEKLEGKNS